MGRFDFVIGPSQPECGTSATVAEAIGEAVIGFEFLDDQVATSIAFLLRRGDSLGRIVTAELSFRGKLDLLLSLFAHERPESVRLLDLRELVAGCFQVEARRNQIVHSRWLRGQADQGVKRVKHSARGKRGLQTTAEQIAPDQVDALWQHCSMLDWWLDQIMLEEFGPEYESSYVG